MCALRRCIFHIQASGPRSGMAILGVVEQFLHEEMIEEEDPEEEQPVEPPKVTTFTETDLVRWVSYLFVFGVYLYIFLKIVFLA